MSWFELMWHALAVFGHGARPGWRPSAQSTVEYALVGALVVIAAAAALTVLGDQVTAVFGNISNTLRAGAH
jgi:Flp pilus assembly pilin Flp